MVDADGDAGRRCARGGARRRRAGGAYTLSWWARTEKADQEYTVLLEAANAEGRLLSERNVLKVFKGTGDWKKETLDIKGFGPGAASVRLRLFPAFRSADGTTVGTAWFDDIVLARRRRARPRNLLGRAATSRCPSRG